MTTVIDQLPQGPNTNDPENFDAAADALIAALPKMIQQQNAANAEVSANTLAASGSAKASADSATAAAKSVEDVAEQAGKAAQSAGAAAGSAGAAATSATAAANSATALTATSTTSLTVSVGAKTLAIQAGKQFATGVDVKLVDAANTANAMYGTVTAYAGTSLQVNVASVVGGGTAANWIVSVIGPRGQQGLTGGVNGGALTGALFTTKGVDMASTVAPAAVDIWNAGGNFFTLAGNAAVTGFAAAPQAGAHVRVLVAGTPKLTAGPNLVIKGVQSGQSYTCAAGDELEVWAETATKFQVTVHKGDGTAMAALYGSFMSAQRYYASGTFTARKTGWHRITVIGSGGRGGAARTTMNAHAFATGGGAAGFAVGMRFLVAGTAYTVGVAAATAGATLSVDGTLDGIAGNASSFSGGGIIPITAYGGGGGKGLKTNSVAGQTATVAGGAGGTATGGDLNVTGGAGGSISVTFASGDNAGWCTFATGGGAVGIQGTGFPGGSITLTNFTPTATVVTGCGTGGGGVGGRGGNVSGSTVAVNHTCGGGAGGPAGDNANGFSQAGPNFAGVSSPPGLAAYDSGISVFMNATGAGGAQSYPPGYGGGAPGVERGVNAWLGGSGGALGGDANSGITYYGGGSGAVTVSTYQAAYITASGPSSGLVQIEF